MILAALRRWMREPSPLRGPVLLALLQGCENSREIRDHLAGGDLVGGPSFGALFRELEALEACDLVLRSEQVLAVGRMRFRSGRTLALYTLTAAGRAAALALLVPPAWLCPRCELCWRGPAGSTCPRCSAS